MDRQEMSHEENYCFDISGYLILRGVLTPGEVEACNRALELAGSENGMLGWPAPHREPFRELMVHPLLVNYLNQLIGYGFRLDREPQLIGSTEGAAGGLVGGNEPMDAGRAYYILNGRRHCQGIHAIWALSDSGAGNGGFSLVPCSHKSNVETPDDVLTGRDDLGLTVQPSLDAGDLMLCAATLLQGVRPGAAAHPQQLLQYSYAGHAAVQSTGTGPKTRREDQPEWMEQLTPEQRVMLHKPGYSDTDPPPTLSSDGETCWVDPEPDLSHPSIYIRNPDSNIDEKEFYFWDLCGHLVLRNVMTPEDLALANEAIDRFSDRIVVESVDLAMGSKSLAGTGRPTIAGLLEMPRPYCEPFRKMLAHPAVVHRLTWMGGKGFRCTGFEAICTPRGGAGHFLHGGNEPLSPSRNYTFQNGRSYALGGPSVGVAWQLRDVTEDDGGFACVPGSHKSQYGIPKGVWTCDEDMGLVLHPLTKAGDVIFFMDGPQAHGALAWKSDVPRRVILTRYSSRHFNGGPTMATPEERWGDLLEGMDEAQLAVMRGPDRDEKSSNVPRLVSNNGSIEVIYDRSQGGLYTKATPKKAPSSRQ